MSVSEIPRAEIERVRSFETHNNGCGPFIVEIGPRIIKVNDWSEVPNHVFKYTELYHTIENFQGVFVGESDYSAGDINTGNCILVHLDGNRYVFIGREVYEFETVEPITNFIAHIGPNDVPYPYAETKNYIYYLQPHENQYSYTYKENTGAPDVQLTRMQDMKETDEVENVYYDDYEHEEFSEPYSYLYDNFNTAGEGIAFYPFEVKPIVKVTGIHRDIEVVRGYQQ
jgi:hypothetical protein